MRDVGFRPSNRTLAYCTLKGATISWRGPKGATYRLIRLEEQTLCIEAKGPNNGRALQGPSYTMTPGWPHHRRTQDLGERANPLGSDKARRATKVPIPLAKRQASVNEEGLRDKKL